MSANLDMDMDKTELLWAATRHTLVGSRGPSLLLDADTVAASDDVRVLGVTISSDLSLEKHVTNISSDVTKLFKICIRRMRMRMSLDKGLFYHS